MRFLKNVKSKLAIAIIFAGCTSSTQAFWFTGGPTFDPLSLAENVTQNLDQIEQHITDLADMEALRKIVKEQAKAAIESSSDKSMSQVKHQQDMETVSKNHDIVVEMAPSDIPGCFSNDPRITNEELEKESEKFIGPLFAYLRNITDCEEWDRIAQAEEERPLGENQIDVEEISESILGGDAPEGSNAGEVTKESAKFIQKYAKVTRNIHDAFNSHPNDENHVDRIASIQPLIDAVMLLQPSIPMLDFDDHVTAKESAMLLTGVYKKEYLASRELGQNKKLLQQEKEDMLRNTSRELKKNYPYQVIRSQVEEKHSPDPTKPSKLGEIDNVGQYYASDMYIKKVAESGDGYTEVIRKKTIANAFRAYVALNQYKKSLEREKMLAFMLVDAVNNQD